MKTSSVVEEKLAVQAAEEKSMPYWKCCSVKPSR